MTPRCAATVRAAARPRTGWGEPNVGHMLTIRCPHATDDSDVDGRERVRQGGVAATTEIDGRGGEQGEVDDRRRDQQRHAEPRAPQHVPGGEARDEDQPEGDLGGDDEREHPYGTGRRGPRGRRR